MQKFVLLGLDWIEEVYIIEYLKHICSDSTKISNLIIITMVFEFVLLLLLKFYKMNKLIRNFFVNSKKNIMNNQQTFNYIDSLEY